MAESVYKVIEGYEVMRLTHAENLEEVKRNKEKVQDREMVVVTNPPKLLVKIGPEFYSVDLVREVM